MRTVIGWELAAVSVLFVVALAIAAFKGFTFGKFCHIMSWVFQHPWRAYRQRYPEDWDVKERR